MHDTKASPRTRSKNRKRRADSHLLAITVDTDTARVVRVDGVSARGARRKLSDDERAQLLHAADHGLDDFVERVFEAGIACMLDDLSPETTDEESPEEAAIRHELLAPLIERSGIRRMLAGPALDRAMLTTLIDHAAH